MRRKIEHTSASPDDSPSRLQALVAVMLLFTLALGLHVQLARYDNLSTFPTRHILHGDLRPDSGTSSGIFADIHDAVALVFAAGLLPRSNAAPRRFSGSVAPSAEPVEREFLNYLALFVRPPPVLFAASC
ncbi:hypothetical protein [Candidatus Binatus sp.]|uniref:hypothetical protein n=1 Tax=Candidatus Binatus sp. TaxID=2811406 RepID=UPI003C84C97E